MVAAKIWLTAHPAPMMVMMPMERAVVAMVVVAMTVMVVGVVAMSVMATPRLGFGRSPSQANTARN